MTVCERMSERMPDVLTGARAWEPEEAAHLEACPECRLEWRIVQAARQLGTDVADGLDEHHVTQRVIGRLRAASRERRNRRWGVGAAVLAAAAAVLLAVWTGGPGDGGARADAAVEVAVLGMPLPELEDMDVPALESVLETLDDPLNAVDRRPAGLGDLDPAELEQLLDAMEG